MCNKGIVVQSNKLMLIYNNMSKVSLTNELMLICNIDRDVPNNKLI